MLKPTATTARPLLVDGSDNRIDELILLLHLTDCVFRPLNADFKKSCRQTCCLTSSYYNLYHQLSHDIQTFNQGHEIAVIYISTGFYIRLQIIMNAGST